MQRLTGFVVSDDEPVEPMELPSDEEEWESGDDTDKEEEEEELYD